MEFSEALIFLVHKHDKIIFLFLRFSCSVLTNLCVVNLKGKIFLTMVIADFVKLCE